MGGICISLYVLSVSTFDMVLHLQLVHFGHLPLCYVVFLLTQIQYTWLPLTTGSLNYNHCIWIDFAVPYCDYYHDTIVTLSLDIIEIYYLPNPVFWKQLGFVMTIKYLETFTDVVLEWSVFLRLEVAFQDCCVHSEFMLLPTTSHVLVSNVIFYYKSNFRYLNLVKFWKLAFANVPWLLRGILFF